MAEAPEWCVPGARCVMTEDRDERGGYRHRTPLMAVTVERLTKTLVIVRSESGTERRFRLDGPDRRPYQKATGPWASPTYLAPRDAADVQSRAEQSRQATIRNTVEVLVKRWQRGDTEAARQIPEKLVEAGVIADFSFAVEAEVAPDA